MRVRRRAAASNLLSGAGPHAKAGLSPPPPALRTRAIRSLTTKALLYNGPWSRRGAGTKLANTTVRSNGRR